MLRTSCCAMCKMSASGMARKRISHAKVLPEEGTAVFMTMPVICSRLKPRTGIVDSQRGPDEVGFESKSSSMGKCMRSSAYSASARRA